MPELHIILCAVHIRAGGVWIDFAMLLHFRDHKSSHRVRICPLLLAHTLQIARQMKYPPDQALSPTVAPVLGVCTLIAPTLTHAPSMYKVHLFSFSALFPDTLTAASSPSLKLSRQQCPSKGHVRQVETSSADVRTFVLPCMFLLTS